MDFSRSFHLALFMAILLAVPNAGFAAIMNEIDKCWRRDPYWRSHREELALCSVGFAGKMTNNVGKNLTLYKVTDASDDPLNPKPGTLRYGTTFIKGKVWITFVRNMRINLKATLLISSFTAIDGRGVDVHITGSGCLFLYEVSDVIIHGLRIHHCKAQGPIRMMGSENKTIELGAVDGDAIRLVAAKKVWIDHNSLYKCEDGLVDVTLGSTLVTISSNRFKSHDKVMLLGHDDQYLLDRNMRASVIYNHFGPKCNQRMPRVRHGYAHVANNLYKGWMQYAIGGSMQPRIKSEGNLFEASKNREVTWRKGSGREDKGVWNFYSVGDLFRNGASFKNRMGKEGAKPHYNHEQRFKVADARLVRGLTRSAGALRCSSKRMVMRC